MLNQAKNTNPNITYIKSEKVVNIPAIVIIPEISQLQNLNSTEQKVLALISQLDNKNSFFARNPYLMKIFNLSKRQVQNIIAKLEKFKYISRTLRNFYERTITSIFSIFYKNKKTQKPLESIAPPGESDCTNKEELNSTLTPESKKIKNKESIQEYLDQNLSESEQIDYHNHISKKRDYNSVSVDNLFFHKGWMKWFKVEMRIKNKGIALGQQLQNVYKNFGSGNKNKNTGNNLMSRDYKPSMRDMEARKNAMMNLYRAV